MQSGLKLAQQLNVKLMLKPELQQSLHILQLSNDELFRFLNEQAIENPVLEVETPISPYVDGRASLRSSIGEHDSLWGMPAKKETIEQIVLSQLRISGIPGRLYPIAAFLAGSLNESGYLTISVDETAAILKQPPESVAEALEHIQSMEPAGIGAMDVRECLLLQIERDPFAVCGAYEAVDLCFSLLAQGKYDKIAQQLGIAKEAALQIADYIRGLKPRPWTDSGSETSYVIPDALIDKEGGQVFIRLNPDSIPKLTLNREYQALSFLKDKVRSATLIQHALKQRKVTLYRVLSAIFEEQAAFLDHGERGLRPLTLRQISEKLQLHESTISRTVQNKYVKTPYGVLELKYFFVSGMQTQSGEYASANQIRITLKELIAKENKQNPLSDQQLAELLTSEGLAISRRTVSKYREELKLPSSTLRKRTQ